MTETTTIIIPQELTELQKFEIGLHKILRRENAERKCKKDNLHRLSLHI